MTKDRLHICLIMQYNGNEIYATRYMKSLISLWTEVDRIFSIVPDRCQILLYENMDSVSLPSCLRYALHMFTAFETDLLCIWSIN